MRGTQDTPRARFVKQRMGKRHAKESRSEEWRLRALQRIVALLAALLVGLTLTAAASANVSFTEAYGWGVLDGASQFETCTSTCQTGIGGGGAGQLLFPPDEVTFGTIAGVAIDPSGDVYVADEFSDRIDEFSAAGAFIKAYGWGVLDGLSQFETCTTTCQRGIQGGGAGQLALPEGIAIDSSGDVYVADFANVRVDEFSAAGAFIEAYGWGVLDGASRFETCTTTCQRGIQGGGAGQLDEPSGVAIDPSGDVYVADQFNNRIDKFSAAGAFVKAYGWGVLDGASQFETCTTTCQAGIAGGGAGQLDEPIGIATDSSGDVYVAANTGTSLADYGNERIDEFSAAGAFMKAYGWGVLDGASQFETCTTTCQQGSRGGGAGQLDSPSGVAIDSSGDVYVADEYNSRIDEFSAAGAFIEAYGWGVLDGVSQFETCTTTCQAGSASGAAGQLADPLGVAIDSSGDVYVADSSNERIDEFSATGAMSPVPVSQVSPVGPAPPVNLTLSASTRKLSAAGRKVNGRCVKLSKKNKAGRRCQLSIKLKATYALSAPATVRFRLALKTTGRKVSGKCVKATRKNKHHSKCTLLSVQKTITRSGVAGSNNFSFTGKLAAGTYQLTASPPGAAPETVTLRVTG